MNKLFKVFLQFTLLCTSFLFSEALWPQKVSAAEDSLYDFSWLDADKRVYVLQNRRYTKAQSLHVELGAAMLTSGSFVDSFALHGRLGYFFLEEWGVEVIFSKANSKTNAAIEMPELGNKVFPFHRAPKTFYGVSALWSPFYAKFNTFNQIIYVDWIFGLGVGSLDEENNKTAIRNNNSTRPMDKESHTGVLWQTGFKFYITEMYHLRVDLLGFHYQAERANEATQRWYQNTEASLSFGINL